jgi:hypothetical protein
MKVILTLSLIISFYCGFGQTFYEIRPIKGDVIEIKQIDFKNNFFRSGWKSYYYFNDNNEIIRNITYFKNDVTLEEIHEHSKEGNTRTIKTNEVDTVNRTTRISYFNNLGQLEKIELYYGQDEINPEIVTHDYEYNLLGNIKSYKSTHYYRATGFKYTECFKLEYIKEQLTTISKYDSCLNLSKKIDLKYDDKGNPASEKIDGCNPDMVYLGSRSDKGIIRYFYKYDKKGNWIKRFYVTSTGNKILELKRKIKYKNGA